MSSARHAYLVFGAGAVGQVFAAHLAAQGHDVALWVRPEHREILSKKGIQVFYGRKRRPVMLEAPKLVVDATGLDRTKERVVLLCIRSDQMEAALPTLKSFPERWPVVFFHPAFEDFSKLQANLGPRILMRGNPGFSSFFEGAKLVNQASRWTPSLVSVPTGAPSSAAPLARQIVGDLKGAQLPARLSGNVAQEIEPLFAFGVAFLLGLEYHGFHMISFLHDSDMFHLARRAARQAAHVVLKAKKFKPSGTLKMLLRLPAFVLRVLMLMLLAAPDSHQYRMWAAHGPKIAKQSRQMALEICKMAQASNQPIQHLQKLLAQLDKLSTCQPPAAVGNEKIS